MLKREWAWVKRIWAGPTQSPGMTPGLVTSRRFGPKWARFLDRLAPVRKARPDPEEILQNDVVTVGLKTTPEPPRATSFQLPMRTPSLRFSAQALRSERESNNGVAVGGFRRGRDGEKKNTGCSVRGRCSDLASLRHASTSTLLPPTCNSGGTHESHSYCFVSFSVCSFAAGIPMSSSSELRELSVQCFDLVEIECRYALGPVRGGLGLYCLEACVVM